MRNFPKNISIGYYEGFCNLTCPKCPAHGKGKNANKYIKGTMGFEKACKLFNELKGEDLLVASGAFSEPFLQKDIWRYLEAIKKRKLKININTNGLLITEKCVKQIMDLKIDCIFISVDALTKDIFKKVRGIDGLEIVKKAVFSLLEARGDRLYPRIGVSFIEEDVNIHEREEFVSFWLQHVDVIRVAKVYSEEHKIDPNLILNDRKPCAMLYEVMVIHYNGDVPMCCWDPNGKTKVGNVFEDGIKRVWLGKELQKIRHYHETGQFDKVPFCSKCAYWSRYEVPTEEVVSNVLIRRSSLMTYYNRIDRLNSWVFSHEKYKN